MYVYAFGEEQFCMFNANKVFVFVFSQITSLTIE